MKVFGLPGSICRLAERPPPELSSKAQERLRCNNAFRALIQQGKDLAQIKGGFNESEAALITSIYNEIKSGS